ncbi:hypothetical protein SteCoe_12432 [Stentor coeruleus]|uniref:Phosphodiesterase n=1 Tax=Stentor coeruleus TaxID=5963 RepID=A0A1R2CAP7_9CILI|nr:hypothetical protein SteCoe_12432 [Stentor coeruleus]
MQYKPVNKRRFGIQEDNLGTELAGTNYYTTESLKKLTLSLESTLINKIWFKNLTKLGFAVYFVHILFHIEFREVLNNVFIYFAIVEGFCLLIMLINLILNILKYKMKYITITKSLDSLALIIGILIFIIELINPEAYKSTIFKLGSIYRFMPLITLVKFKKPTQDDKKKFMILPFKTNSDRLINILRSLRAIEFISNDTLIDSQLEWGIRVISNQTLYNVEIFSDNKEQEELIHWALSKRPKSESATSKSFEIPIETLEAELPIEIRQNLVYVDKISFNVFELKKVSENNELVILTNYLMHSYDLFRSEMLNRQKFSVFMKNIQAGYYQNPYHNATHATDVTQAYHVYIKRCKVEEFLIMTNLDIACCLISSSIHDFQHPGLNNAFLMNSSHNLAVLYNDSSVLENHHVAASFALLQDKNQNFFESVPIDIYRKYRKNIINLVLATDFSKHFKDIAKLKLIYKDMNVEKTKDFMLRVFMHAADISNSTRKWDTYFNWAQLVLEEFFSQGDKEKSLGIPISPLCDRTTVNFAKSQIGFIDLFIIPLFSIFVELMPKFNKSMKNVQDNREKLQAMVDEENEENKENEALESN